MTYDCGNSRRIFAIAAYGEEVVVVAFSQKKYGRWNLLLSKLGCGQVGLDEMKIQLGAFLRNMKAEESDIERRLMQKRTIMSTKMRITRMLILHPH